MAMPSLSRNLLEYLMDHGNAGVSQKFVGQASLALLTKLALLVALALSFSLTCRPCWIIGSSALSAYLIG